MLPAELNLKLFCDGYELYKHWLLNEEESKNYDLVRGAIHKLGYNYVGYSGLDVFDWKDNEYFNKKGDSITRDQFWDNFDAENGTKIIR